jgi:hypothetical protein
MFSSRTGFNFFVLTQKVNKKVKAVSKITKNPPVSLKIYKLSTNWRIKQCRFF